MLITLGVHNAQAPDPVQAVQGGRECVVEPQDGRWEVVSGAVAYVMRVVTASIMPTLIGENTNAPTT